MTGAALESLLQSNAIDLKQLDPGSHGDHGRDEVLRWEDPAGPLKIYSVSAGGQGFHCLRHADEIRVDVHPEGKLAVASAPGTAQATIDHFLADQVFPRLLSSRAALVLHAGAVHDGGHALLFIGPSGSGKSTLSASFGQAGWTLMGDDAVLLSTDNGPPAARAVYPSLRLFPDSIESLFPQGVAAEVMADYSSKQRIALPEAQASEPMRVKAAFILDAQHTPHIAIAPLSVADSCMALVGNAFALDPSDADAAARRLVSAGRAAGSIPAFTLSFPRRYSRLAEVRAAILATLGGETATGP